MTHLDKIVEQSFLVTISQKEDFCFVNADFKMKLDRLNICYDILLDQKKISDDFHGFRPGKVPKEIIVNTHGDEIKKDLIDKIIKIYIDKFLYDKRNDYDVIMYSLDEKSLDGFNFTTDFTFKVRFSIAPEFKLPKYIGLEIFISSRGNYLSEEKILEKIEFLKTLYGDFEEIVDDSVKEGDLVHISYKSNLEIKDDYSDEIKKIIESDNKPIYLFPNIHEPIPGINNVLLDSHVGNLLKHDVIFPSDFGYNELSNKKANYNLNILKVERRKKIESESDLCEKLKIKDIDELKKLIIKQLEQEYDNNLLAEKRKKIFDIMSENLDFSVPEDVLSMAIINELNTLLIRDKKISKRDTNIDNVNKVLSKEEQEHYMSEAKQLAIKKTRYYFLLRKISKKQEIFVAEEDVDKYLSKFMEEKNIKDLNNIKQNLISSGKIDKIVDEIMTEKVIEFIINKSKFICN